MRIVIIEDEKLAAEDLLLTIQDIDSDIEIIAVLSSVKEAKSWFKQNEVPDLIFSDIDLGDGQSFEVLDELDGVVPVIFCTAFDEFALQAFKANGIDYIVKPFAKISVDSALEKYKSLTKKDAVIQSKSLKDLLAELTQEKKAKNSSILVHYQDRIVPIRYEDVCLFYVENEVCFLLTKQSKRYTVNKSLEELEGLAGSDFFRINRQMILHRESVLDASNYFGRKLSVRISIPFPETIVVSKNKVKDFLAWLSVG